MLETGDPIDAITRALLKTTRIIHVSCSFFKLVWKLHNLLASRKKDQRKYRRTRHDADKLILKKDSAVVHRYCVRLRRAQWATFCMYLVGRLRRRDAGMQGNTCANRHSEPAGIISKPRTHPPKDRQRNRITFYFSFRD